MHSDGPECGNTVLLGWNVGVKMIEIKCCWNINYRAEMMEYSVTGIICWNMLEYWDWMFWLKIWDWNIRLERWNTASFVFQILSITCPIALFSSASVILSVTTSLAHSPFPFLLPFPVSPYAVAGVGKAGSSVEDLSVRLKVQDSGQCFLLQTARAVLDPGQEEEITVQWGSHLLQAPQESHGQYAEILCIKGEGMLWPI